MLHFKKRTIDDVFDEHNVTIEVIEDRTEAKQYSCVEWEYESKYSKNIEKAQTHSTQRS